MQSFAYGLREIRRQAGNTSYRTLAERTHYSRTVISDAARGERLPTLAVTLAYVEACRGNVDEWRARWHLCQQQLAGRNALGSLEPGAGQAMSPGDTDADRDAILAAHADLSPSGGRSSRQRTGRRLLAAPAVLTAVAVSVLAQAEAAVAWHLASGSHRARIETTGAAGTPTPSASTSVMDGADPAASNCGGDATVLDSRPIVLPSRATIGDRSIPAGTVLGSIELRYSPHCGGAWARFDPAGGVFGDNPTVAAILLTVSRPADGTQATWRLPHVDETYSDLLLTGMGCVTAAGTVELVGQRVNATAQTRCLPHA